MFPRSIVRASRTATRSISTSSSDPVLAQLLSLSLPLIKSTGFSTETLIRASVLLPPPHTPLSPSGYTTATLNALFPSPPPTPKVNSMTREEIMADARGEMEGEALGRERFGPAQALVEEWLREGRRFMCDQVRENGSKGEAAIRMGMEERIRYNQDYIDLLPDVSPLLIRTKGKSFISYFITRLSLFSRYRPHHPSRPSPLSHPSLRLLHISSTSRKSLTTSLKFPEIKDKA